jgi:hypothetical protein
LANFQNFGFDCGKDDQEQGKIEDREKKNLDLGENKLRPKRTQL